MATILRDRLANLLCALGQPDDVPAEVEAFNTGVVACLKTLDAVAELAHQELLTEDSEEYAAYQAGLNRKSLERARRAEAELIALWNRRCEECASWHGHNYCAEGIGEETDVPELPGPDFACNRWTARAEEGSE